MDPVSEVSIPLAMYLKLVIPVIAATGGASAAAVKVVLNGGRKQIAETHAEMKEMRKDIQTIDGRLIRVETKLDNAKIALEESA
jgi:hypothetical protein